ncbi:MAG: hypothetical protein AAFO07_16055 [Bacteroidota bacterium]
MWPLNRQTPEKTIISYSMQTNRYRYTEWYKGTTDELVARDLFDHETDPDENVNIANLKENEGLVEKLSKRLNKGKGWRIKE